MSAQRDWAQDYDLFDPEYVADPYPIWAELRTACPVAHTDRYGGSWLTTTYDDVTRVARDPATFSSRDVSVIPPPDDTESAAAAGRTAAHPGRPSSAHVVAAAAAAVVLERSRGRVRGLHTGAVPDTARRLRRVGTGRRRGRLRQAGPGPGHRQDARHSRGDVRHVHRVGAQRVGVRQRRTAADAGTDRQHDLLPRGDGGATDRRRDRPDQRAPARRGRRPARSPTRSCWAPWH